MYGALNIGLTSQFGMEFSQKGTEKLQSNYRDAHAYPTMQSAPKKQNPGFNFVITFVNVHRF